MLERNAITCLTCNDIILDEGVCTCSNMGVLRDIDGHLHIYVDDIRTTRLLHVYTHNGKEVRRELMPPMDHAPLVKYIPIRTTPILFEPKKVQYIAENPRVKYPMDKDLIKALEGKR